MNTLVEVEELKQINHRCHYNNCSIVIDPYVAYLFVISLKL
jgi:hypothetical protein